MQMGSPLQSPNAKRRVPAILEHAQRPHLTAGGGNVRLCGHDIVCVVVQYDPLTASVGVAPGSLPLIILKHAHRPGLAASGAAIQRRCNVDIDRMVRAVGAHL